MGNDPEGNNEDDKQMMYIADGTDANNRKDEGAITPVLSSTSSSSEECSPKQLLVTPAPVSVHSDTFATPSPLLLNPLSTKELNKTMSRQKSITQGGSSTLEELVCNLIIGYPAVMYNNKVAEGKLVYIRLNDDNSSVHLEPVSTNDNGANYAQKMKSEAVHTVRASIKDRISLPLKEIELVDVGKIPPAIRSHQLVDRFLHMKCFSVSLLEEKGCKPTFDFVVTTPIERTKIVSTLFALVEQNRCHHQSLEEEVGSIVCNAPPSETIHSIQNASDSSRIAAATTQCSMIPSLTGGSTTKKVQLRPKHQDHETSLVVTSSETSSSNVLAEKCNDGVNGLVMPSLGVPSDIDSTLPSSEIDMLVSAAGGPGTMTTSSEKWCADTMCSFTINDMTTTWNEMFCSLDEDNGAYQACERCSGIRGKCVCSEVTTKHQFMQSCAMNVVCSQPDMPFLLEEGLYDDHGSGDDGALAKKEYLKVNDKLKNRAVVSGGQAIRKSVLQREMNFTNSLDIPRKITYLQTTMSLDYDEVRGLPIDDQRTLSRVTGEAPVAELLLHLVGNTESISSNKTAGNEVLYYDSDPDDIRPRGYRKGPRRVIANRMNKACSEDASGGRKAMNISSTPSTVMTSIADVDEDTVEAILEDMKSETMILIWHPSKSHRRKNRSPVCVRAWIERGTYLTNCAFIQPKLMWTAACERNLESKRLNLSFDKPDFVDLLDVSRLLETDDIDRRIHPFANKSKSFVIETRKETFLFEAETRSERDHLVFRLKFLVARLASLLMLKDLRAMEEFFEPVAARVPGEAPTWATGKSPKNK